MNPEDDREYEPEVEPDDFYYGADPDDAAEAFYESQE